MRVLVAGGGVAGLETVLALRGLAGERVEIELIAPTRHFTYRPMAVAAPFRGGAVTRIPLAAIAAERGVLLRRDALARVLPDDGAVLTQGGARVEFDALVVALGGRPVEAIPGALTFRGPQDAGRLADVVERLHAGAIVSAAFVVPSHDTWALPLYELAMQTAVTLRDAGARSRLAIVTPERAPLEIFGERASAEVAELLAAREIQLHTALAPGTDVETDIDADAVVTLPRLLGPRLRGLPSDRDGFIPVDDLTRVDGFDLIHAVGDSAAQPIKQGGLATQQADVAARAIAAAAGAPVEPRPYRPVLRGLLLAGGEVRYLRNEPDGDSEASEELLWWPPAKIAGRHLAPYLAEHLDLEVRPQPVGTAL
jgi:sulfide:quinone oxidoreductase